MQAGGDGFGRRVTAEHMTFQDPGVFIPCHICKIPARHGKKGAQWRHSKEEKVKRGEDGMKVTSRYHNLCKLILCARVWLCVCVHVCRCV